MSNLITLWDESERRHSTKVALIAGKERFTYQQVGERIRRLAGNLMSRWNVHQGDTIALLAPNVPEFVIGYFAIVRVGAIFQPVDERLMPEEIRACLLDSRARFLIIHHSLWQKYEKIRSGVSSVEGVLCIGPVQTGTEPFEQWIQEGPELRRVFGMRPNDVAELMYTSGTVGKPKGVLRTHANIQAASWNAIRGFGYRGDDVIAITMPMCHSSSLSSQMVPLIQLGGTVVILERFDTGRLIRVIREEQVTCMRAVPAMWRSLLISPQFCSEQLPSLRLLVNSSAPIDPQTYLEIKGSLSGVEVMNSYGLTEASTCTVLPDAMAQRCPDSIGAPIKGVEMCVVDESGQGVKDGTEGEIWVRGEHVFLGYHRRPEETRAVLVNGWLRTGDLGYRDEEGFFYLCGRQDDVINCGGHKVMPFEIESCILELPEIAEVAVVGHPHRIFGEVVKAIVVPKGRQSPDAKRIVNHCARHLASHKVPFFVEFVSQLPKNSVGKVLRQKISILSHGGSGGT